VRISPVIPLLLLIVACDTDDNPPLGLQVAIPNRDGKFDKHHKFPKRAAFVRGKVVSATGIPVIGAHVKVSAFFRDVLNDGLDFDRCKHNVTNASTSTDPAGDFAADLTVDAAVPELCVLVSVVPPSSTGLRSTIVKIDNVLPALNTGLSPVPTVLVNVILTP